VPPLEIASPALFELHWEKRCNYAPMVGQTVFVGLAHTSAFMCERIPIQSLPLLPSGDSMRSGPLASRRAMHRVWGSPRLFR